LNFIQNVKLFETSNKIEFHYGTSAALASASVGLGGINAATEYLNVLTANTVLSGDVEFAANTLIPGNSAGMQFIFTPTERLTATPACLAENPVLWAKADAGNNTTRTFLNVPGTSRTVTSTISTFRIAANSVFNSSYAWIPSVAEGANAAPTGVMGAITLDLGSVKTIDGIGTMGAADNAWYTIDYTVRVSSDNVNWTHLGLFAGNENNTELHYADFDQIPSIYQDALRVVTNTVRQFPKFQLSWLLENIEYHR
jgi:hypothetical protein